MKVIYLKEDQKHFLVTELIATKNIIVRFLRKNKGGTLSPTAQPLNFRNFSIKEAIQISRLKNDEIVRMSFEKLMYLNNRVGNTTFKTKAPN